MSERDEFEAWVLENWFRGNWRGCPSFDAFMQHCEPEGKGQVDRAWAVWQASRATPQQALTYIYRWRFRNQPWEYGAEKPWHAERSGYECERVAILADARAPQAVPALRPDVIADLIWRHTGLSEEQFPGAYGDSVSLVKAVLAEVAAPQPSPKGPA